MSTVSNTNLCVKDVMTVEPVCIERDTPVRQIARLFEEHEISGAPVVDVHGCLIGVISRTDLFNRWISGESDRDPAVLAQIFGGDEDSDVAWLSEEEEPCAMELMTDMPVSVSETTTVAEVARQMLEGRIHRVIVVDRLRIPVGIVTSLDLVKVLSGA